jgi:hypothetical protein
MEASGAAPLPQPAVVAVIRSRQGNLTSHQLFPSHAGLLACCQTFPRLAHLSVCRAAAEQGGDPGEPGSLVEQLKRTR